MNCLVVGATGGIGKSIVDVLLKKNIRIVASVRNVKKIDNIWDNHKEEVRVVRCDVRDDDQVDAMFKSILENNIKLDAMVYCVGQSVSESIRFLNVKNLKETMEVNAFGFVKCLKWFSGKRISNDGASVVAISSLSSEECTSGMCAYSMSKAAMNAAVMTGAKELMRRRIRVNAILPGYVDTEMVIKQENREEILEEYMTKQPLGVISPRRIADLVDYLVSEESEYITGELIHVSGGRNGK